MENQAALLREEFQSWLSDETWRWTTYATLTFARPMKRDALRFARVWVQSIARTATKVWGFSFQETHSDGARLHVHLLLSVHPNLLGEPSNREMWSWWFRNFGRAHVVTFQPHRRPKAKAERPGQSHKEIAQEYISPLAAYLTKYMVKESFSDNFDWDFYAFVEGFELTADEFGRYSGVNPSFVPSGGPV